VRPVLVLVATIALALGCSTAARAQDKLTLSGSWSASALTESWNIGEWGDACGQKPRPQGAGAGTVQVREQGGELSIIGAGRAWSTAECWEQMPGLARTSHSQSGGGRFWRTRCSTPPSEPRSATVVTTVQATDTTMSFHETGQYQFVIQGANCTASVTRSRSFTLMKREGDAPAATSAAPSASAGPAASGAPPATPAKAAEPSPAAKTCTGSGGAPARLEVRPSKKLLRPGDKFAFRALVVDAEGCVLGTRPSWSITPGPLAEKASVDASGQVTIADDAGEGVLEIAAMVAGKSVSVAAEVASAERFEALVATGEVNDAGEADQAAVVVIATGALAGERGVAEDGARRRRYIFVGIVTSLAGLLAFAGLLFARRSRRVAEARAAMSSLSSIPPPEDETEEDLAPRGAGPSDADAPKPTGNARGKICPICGQQYAAESAFCGKDGATLVLIN
jgi:hypothetical protein